MKKNLLTLTIVMLLTVLNTTAQTKVWDFGADPLGAGFTDMITVANQTSCALFTAGSPTGGTTAVPTLTASATFGDLTINTFAGDRWRSDNLNLVIYDTALNNTLGGSSVTPVFTGAVKSGRLAFNGTGTATRRYYTIVLTAGQTATFYWKSNLTATGTLTVTPPAGSTVSTSLAYNATGATSEMRTSKITADIAGSYTIGDYTGKMETYRIYGADVTGAVNLDAEGFEKGISLDVFAIDRKVHITNIISETKIEVYNLLGSLIKTITAKENASIDLSTTGVYIVNVKNAEGQKSVKVSIQ